jgi:sulfate adenylyltransferase
MVNVGLPAARNDRHQAGRERYQWYLARVMAGNPASATGACIWLTGRSGAGKSTVVRALTPLLDEAGRTYSVLDVVPLLEKHRGERTSEGKLLRKAFVAAEIVRHGGIVICVTISARRDIRERARHVIGAAHFIEVYVDTPPEVASSRKAARGRKVPVQKRLKAVARRLARRGGLRAPTDGYDVPANPAVVIVGSGATAPEVGAEAIVAELVRRGVLSPAS